MADPISRRSALARIGLIFNGVVAAVLAVPVVKYLKSPTRKPAKADDWISLGPLSQFPVGETRMAAFRNPVVNPSDGKTADIPCWVRRVDERKFQVFAINCAHLGCPVRWFAQSNLFLCPCHGGAYYADGSRASGPPERGLFEYVYRIEGNELWIQAQEMPTPGPTAYNDGKRHLKCV
ncbi:MAG TPA: Rieske 2Fe-2S domain-containing protein [Haliangiales bacterium]|nr:Rieske 2Fe-2S domain-containing protein [Haliangiales bacterium]